MAKAKKLEKMTDEELIAPLPPIVIETGTVLNKPTYDFAAQKQFLEVRINQVLSEELTDENLERIKILKKGVTSWRTAFDKEAKAYMDASFKAPMNIFKAASNEVLVEINALESKLDEVLDKEVKKRIDNLNIVFDSIEEELQEEFNLPEEYKAKVERKKNYYNKTAVMNDVAKDLRTQYTNLAKEYSNYKRAVDTVTELCSVDKRLNTDMYIKHLDYSDLTEVMDEIKAEKKRLSELDEPKPAVQEPLSQNEEGKIEIGVKANPKALASDFPGITKTMTLKITYPIDCGDELTRIFAELKKNGIKMNVISCVENAAEVPKF